MIVVKNKLTDEVELYKVCLFLLSYLVTCTGTLVLNYSSIVKFVFTLVWIS